MTLLKFSIFWGGDVVALPCFITSSSMKLKKKDEIIKEH